MDVHAVIVTGVSRGLGEALGVALLARGATVLGLGRTSSRASTSNPRAARWSATASTTSSPRAATGDSPRYLKIQGRWRDHVRCALLFEDWRARQRAR